MNEPEGNKYDEVQTPEPTDQPSNPLGEATDPAATVGNEVQNATPTESSDPNPANAADRAENAAVVPAPVEQEQGGASENSQDSDQN